MAIATTSMGGTTTDLIGFDNDTALTVVGAELPDRLLDAFVDSELLDAAAELAALLEVRRQFERHRKGLE
jgi:hypothetical protein